MILRTQSTSAGGVRHDPQRFMGKTVYVPHFNRDTVEFASRERDHERWIKTRDQNAASLSEKHYGERFEEFSRSETIEGAILAGFRQRFPASQKILGTV